MRISDWSSDVCSSDLSSYALSSVAHERAVEEDDFHLDARRHFDHRLILLRPFDQVLGEHVASLAPAFADAALRDIASRELLALAIDDRCCPRQKAARIRGRSEAHNSELQSLMRITYA